MQSHVGITAQGSELLSSLAGAVIMSQSMASPRGLLSPPSPHAPVPSSAFVADPACRGRERHCGVRWG